MSCTVTCLECKRKFDLLNTQDVEEWTYGHDCDNSLLFCLSCGGYYEAGIFADHIKECD